MATHSSVLAWRIPGTGEPGGLPSVGSHRVRHDWSNLAAAAAAACLGFLRSSSCHRETSSKDSAFPAPPAGCSALTPFPLLLETRSGVRSLARRAPRAPTTWRRRCGGCPSAGRTTSQRGGSSRRSRSGSSGSWRRRASCSAAPWRPPRASCPWAHTRASLSSPVSPACRSAAAPTCRRSFRSSSRWKVITRGLGPSLPSSATPCGPWSTTGKRATSVTPTPFSSAIATPAAGLSSSEGPSLHLSRCRFGNTAQTNLHQLSQRKENVFGPGFLILLHSESLKYKRLGKAEALLTSSEVS